MPLSVSVGRRDLFTGTSGRIFYHPTFKVEAYLLRWRPPLIPALERCPAWP